MNSDSDSNFSTINAQTTDVFDAESECCKNGGCNSDCECKQQKEAEEEVPPSQSKDKVEKSIGFNKLSPKKVNSFPKRVEKRRGNIRGIGRRG